MIISLFPRTMPEALQQLCDVCANINFAEYFQREVNVHRVNDDLVSGNRDARRLGYLKEVHGRSNHCSFCRLAVKALCKRWLPSEWVSPERFVEQSCEQGTEMECFIYSYSYADNGEFDPTSAQFMESSVSEKVNRIGIGVRAPTATTIPYLDHAGDIQLLATSAAKVGKSSLFYGRVIDPMRVKISLIQQWLSLCENQHGRLCETPAFEPEDASPTVPPKDLLVVDVQGMCLCLLPEGRRYIALSYCWPNKVTFVTTQTIFAELFDTGSLKGKMASLCQAIQDAIHCVNELGETYLWVDALCIVQDNEENKRTQIQQMDRVYGSAVLTLICAFPDPEIGLGTYDGLPGYQVGTRISGQDVEEVQGLSLSTTFLSVDLAISESRWNTRAWTFQEARLSRRKLFFTETQLYFQCPCSVFCEDVVGEGNSASALFYPGTTLWNTDGIHTSHWRSQEGASTWLSRSPCRSPVESFRTYSRLLDQYSGRQMSDPSDVVNAFQGILASLQLSMKTEFWVGLPEAYLDEALLWMETGPHLRRRIPTRGSTTASFPSWSWAGWDTTVELENIFSGFVRPEVDWFIISQTGIAIQLTTPGSYNSSLQSQITLSNKTVRPPGEPPKEFLETLQPRTQVSTSGRDFNISCFLACWTSIASFKLTGETFGLEGYGGTSWESRENLAVSDDMGNFAGSIVMDRHWKTDRLVNSCWFEFMLLSRSNIMAKNLIFFDEEAFQGREWCFINVMLIERDKDRAQRLGVGVIHEDAWVKAEPISMLIKLE